MPDLIYRHYYQYSNSSPKKQIQNSMNKIDYLQNQTKQQQEQILELKQIIKVNKMEIDILSSQLKETQHHKLMDIIISYREREQKMQNSIKQLKKEICQLSTDNLVLRQLNDGQNVEMKNMENLHLAAVEILNKKIVEVENKLFFYDKTHKQYDKVSGFVLKNKEIVVPQQVALCLKNKQDQWKDQIAEMRYRVELAKKSEQDLIVVNTVLRNKIVSLQAQLAMPNKNLGEVLDKSLKKLMLYFIEVQKRIITGEDQSDSDSENDLELIAPQLAGVFPEKQLRAQKDYGVPHIDLLKIKDQMNHAGNKAKEALAARNHLTDKQKIERLEIELEYTRREMSKNIIDLRQEKQRRKKAESLAHELEARISLLISSNQQLQAKVRKYWNKLKTQRQKAYGMNQNLDTGKGLVDDEPIHNLDETLKIIQPKKKNKHEGRQNKVNLANPSLLLNQYSIDYKIHLQILSKQLQKNQKLANLKKMRPIKQQSSEKEQEQKGMKRSTSNPLLYFNQRRNDIMEIHEKGEIKNQRQRLEQTCYNPGEMIGFEHVLDQQILDQFQDA